MVSPFCAALRAIAHYAESKPHAPALIEPNGLSFSYAELWAQIVAVGSRLEEAGIGPGETVAVLLPQGVCHVVAITGVLNHCVCAPLQPRTTAVEVEATLGRLSTAALIVSPEFELEAQSALGSGLTVLMARHGQSPVEWEIRHPLVSRKPPSRNSDAVLLLVTSATTAGSKCVPLTVANLDAGAVARRDSLRLTASDRMLLMTSLSHSIGIGTTLSQFLAGGSVIATGGFDPASYLSWFHELRPTWYDCAPAVHQAALVELMRSPPQNPLSLRFVQSAGAPLSDNVRKGLEELLRIPVFNDYGMSEACAIASDAFLPNDRIPNSAGRSCGMKIAIMRASGDLLSTGEEGEIVVRGPAVFSGYADDHESTAAAFKNGWFKTGDLGRLDSEGNLFIVGRLKEMINRGGEKVLPGEVDEAMASHPAVREAAAFSVPHPTLGEDVACAVVLRQGAEAPVSVHELRRYAAERLASFKVPHHIHLVDEIPRGELGKPQRWLLTDRLWGGDAPRSPAEVSETPLARGLLIRALHEIWARILNREDLGFDEDFFEAGGDSLGAINMLAEIDQRFSCQTSEQAASFLDDPTLENLVRLMGSEYLPKLNPGESNEVRIFPVGNNSSGKQIFCVPTDGSEGLIFRRLAKHLDGQLNVSIVRPAVTLRSYALFSIEGEGKEAAAAIRKAQPEGPYFVGGYCYGGVIAVEAARQLIHDGQDVRVILFDVPTPGSPGMLRDFPVWLGRARAQWSRIWTSEHPGLRRNIRRVSRRLVWTALVPFRRLFVPVEQVAAVRAILEWARFEEFPLYKARPLDAPFLHILCMEEPDALGSAARFGWRRIAQRGIEEHFVPFNHQNLLHEKNLPGIVEILLKWCGVECGALKS